MEKPTESPKSDGIPSLPKVSLKAKTTEDKINDITNFLDAIIENIPHMVFVKEAKELRFVRFNRAGEQLLGYDRANMIGKNDFDFFPPEQATFFIQKDREALNKKTVTDIPEEPIETKNGPRWLHTKKIPITDEDGTPLFLLGISEDITEQKRAKEQLLRFAEIFESSSDFVASVRGNDVQVIYINPAGKNMCGIARNEDVTQYKLEDLFPDTTKEKFRQEILPTAVQNGSWEGEVFVVNLQTKKEIPVSMLFLSHKNKKGEIERFSTISRDISEAKDREEQVTALNKELERKTTFLEASNKEINSFTYIVSHDLRAPVRAIHGFTKVLEMKFEKQIDEEAKQLLHNVTEAATRMGHLIDDLLHFSKIRRKDVQKAMVNMDEIVHDIVNDLAAPGTQAKVTIHKLPNAMCDKSLIQQVWTNLISNAYKFSSTKPQPIIEIGSRSMKDGIAYYVKDNGVGFDMKYYNKLFNVFQRLHDWDEFPGTGIGLAIAQRIIFGHDGKMWGKGKVDKGSTFYFCLPK